VCLVGWLQCCRYLELDKGEFTTNPYHLSFFSFSFYIHSLLSPYIILSDHQQYCALSSNRNQRSQEEGQALPAFRPSSNASPPPPAPHLTSEWSHRRPTYSIGMSRRRGVPALAQKLEIQRHRIKVWRSQIDVQQGLIEIRCVRTEVLWSQIEASTTCASAGRAPLAAMCYFLMHLGMVHHQPPPWEMHSLIPTCPRRRRFFSPLRTPFSSGGWGGRRHGGAALEVSRTKNLALRCARLGCISGNEHDFCSSLFAWLTLANSLCRLPNMNKLHYTSLDRGNAPYQSLPITHENLVIKVNLGQQAFRHINNSSLFAGCWSSPVTEEKHTRINR
jgi:hypothetical protein